jgi:hypothetical protein
MSKRHYSDGDKGSSWVNVPGHDEEIDVCDRCGERWWTDDDGKLQGTVQTCAMRRLDDFAVEPSHVPDDFPPEDLVALQERVGVGNLSYQLTDDGGTGDRFEDQSRSGARLSDTLPPSLDYGMARDIPAEGEEHHGAWLQPEAEARPWVRVFDEKHGAVFHFCPKCAAARGVKTEDEWDWDQCEGHNMQPEEVPLQELDAIQRGSIQGAHQTAVDLGWAQVVTRVTRTEIPESLFRTSCWDSGHKGSDHFLWAVGLYGIDTDSLVQRCAYGRSWDLHQAIIRLHESLDHHKLKYDIGQLGGTLDDQSENDDED